MSRRDRLGDAAPPVGSCPPDEVLAAHIARELDDERREQVGAHLDECATCRKIVVGAVRRAEDAVAIPARDSARTSAGRDATSSMTAVAALARDEILRTRIFCVLALGLLLVALAGLPFMGGGYYEGYVFGGCCAVAVASFSYLLYRTRDPATFHHGVGVAVAWYVPAIAASSAVPYFGPYSPVTILSVLGIYFTGLGASRGLATAIYVSCAATELVTGTLVIARLADPGLVHAGYLPTHVLIIGQATVQVVLAATFVIARSSRRTSLTAISELQSAIRAVAQREALLQEAREELRRARGSGRGRFTESTIGHYRLGDVIGRGAMGEVYEGVDTRDGGPVAVKVLSETSLGNASALPRFLREMKTAAAIASPNVVRVLDIGEEPLPHLVMERLRGRDLSSILRDKRLLPPAELIDLLQQVGAGITAAGAAGVIHRDLKPQNVFLADTTWKILDFGVSRLADMGDTLTAGHLVGTPAYMAPEQARGAKVDHRADLYALAAIAYRCLTGHAPFSGDEVADILYRVVHGAPRRPTTLAQVPADLDLALAIGLAKRPEDRFSTARELVTAIADALEGRLPSSLRKRGLALAWEPEERRSATVLIRVPATARPDRASDDSSSR